MQYVFNPRNRQINPVTGQTFVDPTLRDKAVSAELYSLVCKGKVSVEDIAALFAVNKSPEILVKNYKAVKDSPVAKAPENVAKVAEVSDLPAVPGAANEEAPATADGAFDGTALSSKRQPELLIIAATVGVDVNAEGFAPTRPNLIKAIMARAEKAEADATPVAPIEEPSAGAPAAE